MHAFMTRAVLLSAFLLVCTNPITAHAGGYDTPMLYSARHMGMGGTAVGYVADASALFHNPAGLANTSRYSLIADFSLLVGDVSGTPAENIEGTSPGESITSTTTIAPFFLLGGAFRVNDWLTLGLAAYPVASAGAVYEYTQGGVPIKDDTKLIFFEVSPGFAVNLPGHVSLGAGYRVTLMTLDRSVVSTTTGMGNVDFSMSGFNFASFRAGIQWTPIDSHRVESEPATETPTTEVQSADRTRLGFGFNYRHRTNVDIDAGSGNLVTPLTDISSTFTLPGRIAFGARGDLGPVGMAADLEYSFNQQNDRSTLSGTESSGMVLTTDNVFNWSNAITLRLGGEYRLLDGRLALRAGYIYDGKTANIHFPTAFGTPPAATHVGTLGAGYDAGPWEVNLAYAYRRGSANVSSSDLPSAADIAADPSQECLLCGHPGDYKIQLHGIYLDFSYDFE